MFTFLVGIFFTIFLFWMFKSQLANYLLVKPSIRGAHKISIPQGGGLAFALASFFHLNIFGFKLLACIPLLIVSFLDDLIDLPWKLRLSIQILTSILLISNFIIQIPSNFYFYILVSIILIFAITSIINITNFMDGLDGLVSCSMFLVMLTISIDLGLNINFFLGALFGFILINWNPAKVFMGDIGSNFLGFFVCLLILENYEIEKIIASLLLMSPMIFDSGICLIKRFFNEENIGEIFKPHKKHLYQKMHQTGISQKKISLMYIFATFYLCISYLLFYSIGLLLLNSLIIFLGIYVLDNKYSKLINNSSKN